MRSIKKSARRPLTAAEQELMDLIWSRGGLTAEELRAARAPEKQLKDSTVRTLLRRMEDKGYLRHRLEGRSYRYEATDEPTNVAVETVKAVIDRFCGGSVEQLLLGMVETEIVDEEELKRLADKVARSAKRRKT